METEATYTSHKVLFFNTLAFTVCFAAWMLNGVLVTYLVESRVFDWGPVQNGCWGFPSSPARSSGFPPAF